MPDPAAASPVVMSLGGIVASADQLATSAGVSILGLGGNAVDAAIADQRGDGRGRTEPVRARRRPVRARPRRHHRPRAERQRARRQRGRPGGAPCGRAHLDAVPARPRRGHRAGLRERMDGAARAPRFAADGDPARTGDPPRRGRLPGIAAPDRIAGRRVGGRARAAPRTGHAGHPRRCPRPPAGRRPHVARHRRRRQRRVLRRRVRRRPDGDGRRLYTEDDLAGAAADWARPLRTEVWGHTLWGLPPNSQSYLLLAAARIAEALGLGADPDDPTWAHLLVEAAVAAAHDRPARLHEAADGDALLDELSARASAVDPARASGLTAPSAAGDTTYLCTVDETGMAVSLIQSNAAGFGSWLVEPSDGRSTSTTAGSASPSRPATPRSSAPAAGRRTRCARRWRRAPTTPWPPSSARWAATPSRRSCSSSPPGCWSAVRTRRPPSRAPRWVLQPADPLSSGFDTWLEPGGQAVAIEDGAPGAWAEGLAALGHRVRTGAEVDGHLRTRPRDHRRRARPAPRRGRPAHHRRRRRRHLTARRPLASVRICKNRRLCATRAARDLGRRVSAFSQKPIVVQNAPPDTASVQRRGSTDRPETGTGDPGPGRARPERVRAARSRRAACASRGRRRCRRRR